MDFRVNLDIIAKKTTIVIMTTQPQLTLTVLIGTQKLRNQYHDDKLNDHPQVFIQRFADKLRMSALSTGSIIVSKDDYQKADSHYQNVNNLHEITHERVYPPRRYFVYYKFQTFRFPGELASFI